jgi:hypothetical protein
MNQVRFSATAASIVSALGDWYDILPPDFLSQHPLLSESGI